MTEADRSPAAGAIFFDAHCDTVIKVLDDGADFGSGDGTIHVDFPRLREAGVRAQLFACFVLSERYPDRERERADSMLDAIEGMCASTGHELAVARTKEELGAAFEGGPMAALIGLEGADPLGGRAENLRQFFDRGVRDLIFAWRDNLFSGTAFGRNDPLTGEGERLLGLCEELGVMVDVSHLSDAAFEDVRRAATRPFIASHSDCRALSASPRNMTDDMIRALADRGGVMGINFSTPFLSPESLAGWEKVKTRLDLEGLGWREQERRVLEEAVGVPRPSFEWVVRHVLHVIDVGGEDVVGLGGDLDGIVHAPNGLNGVEDYPKVAAALGEAGLSRSQIEKVCHLNFLRAFSDVLPG
ncbi:MAG: membrane dipeptidase [Candidatus Bipolaricaulia bacterium]